MVITDNNANLQVPGRFLQLKVPVQAANDHGPRARGRLSFDRGSECAIAQLLHLPLRNRQSPLLLLLLVEQCNVLTKPDLSELVPLQEQRTPNYSPETFSLAPRG